MICLFLYPSLFLPIWKTIVKGECHWRLICVVIVVGTDVDFELVMKLTEQTLVFNYIFWMGYLHSQCQVNLLINKLN